jgi:hypothetical protein
MLILQLKTILLSDFYHLRMSEFSDQTEDRVFG